MSAPSFQDFLDLGEAEAALRRPELTLAEGDISEMELAAAAAMADHLAGYAAGRFKATYLDGAAGDDLTVLADDHWNVQRRPAISATGTATFTRATALTGGTIPAGTEIATGKDAQGNDVRFVTMADSLWLIGDLVKMVAIEAEAGGVLGNVPAAAITRILSGGLFDTFIVTNAALLAGGSDEEPDEDLRERVRQLPATLRRGTLAALEYGALQVPTVKRARAVEELDGDSFPTGFVTVYVTDIAGGSNMTMTDAVKAELENWRAAGVVVTVTGGSLFVVTPIVLELAVRSGFDVAAAEPLIKAAVVARLAKLHIGEPEGFGLRDLIRQAAMNVDIDNILQCTVVQPAVDIGAAADQILRTTTADVSVT